MKKSLLFVFLLSALLISYAATPTPKEQSAFSKTKTFKLFFQGGKITTFENGKISEQEDKGFKDGEISVTILSEGKGLLIGNIGTGELQVINKGDTICFLEVVGGGVHTLHIFDVKNGEGFLFSYNRTVNVFNKIQTVSTHYGYAKPLN